MLRFNGHLLERYVCSFIHDYFEKLFPRLLCLDKRGVLLKVPIVLWITVTPRIIVHERYREGRAPDSAILNNFLLNVVRSLLLFLFSGFFFLFKFPLLSAFLLCEFSVLIFIFRLYFQMLKSYICTCSLDMGLLKNSLESKSLLVFDSIWIFFIQFDGHRDSGHHWLQFWLWWIWQLRGQLRSENICRKWWHANTRTPPYSINCLYWLSGLLLHHGRLSIAKFFNWESWCLIYEFLLEGCV